MRHPIMGAIVLLVLVPCFSVGQTSLSKGEEMMDRQDFRGALAMFERAVAEDPMSSDSWWWRGYAKQKLGDRKGAIEDYTRSIKIKPSISAYINRGNMKLLEYNDVAGAREDYIRAKILDPNHLAPKMALDALKDIEKEKERRLLQAEGKILLGRSRISDLVRVLGQPNRKYDVPLDPNDPNSPARSYSWDSRGIVAWVFGPYLTDPDPVFREIALFRDFKGQIFGGLRTSMTYKDATAFCRLHFKVTRDIGDATSYVFEDGRQGGIHVFSEPKGLRIDLGEGTEIAAEELLDVSGSP